VLLQALLIVAAGFFVFWPALRGDWLWDDDKLVVDNLQLHRWSGLEQIWFALPRTDYWPLSWTVLWGEWHLWGNHPFGYHLCSLALHLGSGFLIWRILGRLGLRAGWIGGLLFVIHPLAVESTAWISEIKNTLSLPLFLLSFDAWLDEEEERKNSGYLRSVLYYLAAMLAKTSTIMLPLVLLLYSWWKRGTITRSDLRKIIPYLVIALVLGMITFYFQSHGRMADSIRMGSFWERMAGAGMALFFYLGKFLWPTELLPIYPHWTFDKLTLIQILPIPLLAGLFLVLWILRRSWGRHVLFGLGFFVLNVLPVLGLVKMRYLNISPVADHLVYLPMLGLIGLVVAGMEQVNKRLNGDIRPIAEGVVVLVLALMAWESHVYAGKFINQETLWTYELPRNPQAYQAHNNLGIAWAQAGRTAEAMEQFEQTLQIKPDFAEAYCNLGFAWAQTGRPFKAIEQYERALQLKPDFAEAHDDLGNALLQTGEASEAKQHFERALQINPDFAEAHNSLGVALAQGGRVSEAIEQFIQALRINPGYVTAWNNLERMRALQKPD